MRWLAKQRPEIGTYVQAFAVIPVRIDGVWVWFERYEELVGAFPRPTPDHRTSGKPRRRLLMREGRSAA